MLSGHEHNTTTLLQVTSFSNLERICLIFQFEGFLMLNDETIQG